MSKIHRVANIYEQRGLIELYKRSLSWTFWKLKSILYLKNSTVVAIGNNKCTFITETRKEYSRFDNLMGEKKIIKDVLSEVAPDDVVYDVGANVGLYTCFAGKKADEGLVVAFEPHPQNFDRLKQNLELNDLSVQTKQVALSDESDTAKLNVKESDEAGVGSHTLSTDDPKHTIDIQTVRGDDITDGEPLPTVLKIDVEGAEMDVIRGLEECINYCRVVYCEIHPDAITNFDSEPVSVHKYLEKNGFVIEDIFEFGPTSSGYMLKAVREDSNE